MRGERLIGRLRGVRKRKRARKGFACDILSQKMALVERARRRRGSGR